MTLLIMAAGKSSRYGTLKQFEQLGPNNEYLFEFNIFDAIENGFTHIVVVTNEKFIGELKEYLQKKLPKKIKIDVIAQQITDLPVGISFTKKREKPWGTAHAVWTARNIIDEGFVIVNADDYYGKEAFRLAADFISNNQEKKMFGMIAYSLSETLSSYGTVSRGICKVQAKLLLGIYEFKEIAIEKGRFLDKLENETFTGNESVSMNFWICNPYIFKEIELQFAKFIANEFYNNNDEILIPVLIQGMMEDGKIQVEINHTTSKWFGMTYAKDKSNVVMKLNEMSTNGLYPLPLWNN